MTFLVPAGWAGSLDAYAVVSISVKALERLVFSPIAECNKYEINL
jgi:hypothetical protein